MKIVRRVRRVVEWVDVMGWWSDWNVDGVKSVDCGESVLRLMECE